jgi:peptide deformylase
MSILKVARMGHPVLRAKARPFDRAEIKAPVTQKLIDDMIETMHDADGAGLAAIQVHEGLRVFVASPTNDDGDPSRSRWRSST